MSKLFPLVLVVLSIIYLQSCTSYNELVYMQDRYVSNDTVPKVISTSENASLRLLVNDNLYINVYGTDLGQIDLFNKQGFNYPNNSEYSLYMQGYQIGEDGTVELPVVGKIPLEGLTLYEAQNRIQDSINEYIIGAVVDVKLLSFQITILGEVRSPGTYTFLRRDISIFDALGQAGDVQNYGDRKNIIIVRKENGVSKSFMIDLTQTSGFDGSEFWLKPNDVVYVRPLKSKMPSVNSTTITIVLSSITALVLMLNVTLNFTQN